MGLPEAIAAWRTALASKGGYDAVQMRAGAVGTVKLVAGLALVEHALARTGIGGRIDLFEADFGFFFAAFARFLEVRDHVALAVLFALFPVAALGGGIERIGTPACEKENQQRGANGGAGLGKGHCVEHVAFHLMPGLAGVYTL